MTANQLLDLMNSIPDRIVLDAAEGRNEPAPRSHLRFRRVGLLAAVLAALLLLAGCVAVYLQLQDMSIGKAAYVQKFDEKGKAIEPTEKMRDIINFAALNDSPTQKAAREWYEYRLSCGQDALPGDPNIPEAYQLIYTCYTQEMLEKLETIAATNQIALLEDRLPVQNWQSEAALEGLGRTTLLEKDAQATMTQVAGQLYPPYNFRLMYDLTLTGEDAAWNKPVFVQEIYNHTGYLPCDSIWYLDLGDFQQWNYTTHQGIHLLLAMNNTGQGFLFCQQKDGVLTVSISGNRSGTQYPEPDQVPGKEALEQFAEVIDFAAPSSKIDTPTLREKLAAAETTFRKQGDALMEEALQKHQNYDSFGDFLMGMGYGWENTTQYAFYDMDEDGEADLLLGKDGFFDNWLSLKDGKIKGHETSEARICQDGMIEFEGHADFSQQRRYIFLPLSQWVQGADHFSESCMLAYWKGQWYTTDMEGGEYLEEYRHPITQEEADAIRAKYAPIALDWKNIWEFPMDDTGKTLGDCYTSLDQKPGSEELRSIYTEYVKAFSDPSFYTHFCLMDVNGDGVEDLLLSSNGEQFSDVYTYRYGEVRSPIFSWFYPCEGRVWEHQDTVHLEEEGAELDEHAYYQVGEYFQLEPVAYAAYNKATASWQSDRDGTPMDAAEAEAILAKYPRIDLGMKPISELIG